MKIVDVQWRDYRLPFLNSFSTAHGVMTSREGIIVQVTTGQGISGIGEIAPLPALGGGSLADARRLLPKLVACLHHKTLHEALDLVLTEGKTGNVGASATSGVWWGGVALGESRPSESRACINTSRPSPSAASGVGGGPRRVERVSILRPALSTSTLCGLEIALLDLIGKAEGYGVCTLLTPAGSAPRAAVPVNAVIGARATEAAIAIARDARRNGFRCVKLKVGWGVSVREEIERVAAVRDAIGPAMHLRLDANEAWNLEEAIVILSQCAPYDIQYVEQPLNACPPAGTTHPDCS
jgi:L-Ala-D/L-Glu epimerase